LKGPDGRSQKIIGRLHAGDHRLSAPASSIVRNDTPWGGLAGTHWYPSAPIDMRPSVSAAAALP
jgi:hypothetical protein